MPDAHVNAPTASGYTKRSVPASAGPVQVRRPRRSAAPVAKAGEGEGDMPLFEYACKECEQQFELLVRGTETPECPSCRGTSLERRQSVFAARTGGAASTVAEVPMGACGSCGDPRGPGACSLN